jgi:Zn-dependent protease with chaperone function
MSISLSDNPLRATYFDGQTAAGVAVTLSVEGNEWLLRGADLELRWPLREVLVSERLGNTPRLLTRAGTGHCEVHDCAGLDRLLARSGRQRHWLDGVQHSYAWALAAVVLIVVAFAGIYRYLLPWGAEMLAMRVPAVILQKMGSSTLETLDQFALKPSRLDNARRRELSDAYARMKAPGDAQLKYRIVFRSSPSLGANAFALPDGNIVVLDDLVNLTANDNEIIAVLAHERGHVERRHALRMVLQSSVVGLALAWYLGDFSGLLATAPAIILQAKYSRDMEREADDYAKRTLLANGLSPCLLASMLEKLRASHLARIEANRNRPDAGAGRRNEVMDYLSDHPATQERINLLCPAKSSR